MAKIAKTIDLSTSTVYKIVQFSDKYNWEDVEEISEGAFQLSWHRLRDNLSLQREDVLKVYRASHNISEFNRKIKQVKRISKYSQESKRDVKNKLKKLYKSAILLQFSLSAYIICQSETNFLQESLNFLSFVEKLKSC